MTAGEPETTAEPDTGPAEEHPADAASTTTTTAKKKKPHSFMRELPVLLLIALLLALLIKAFIIQAFYIPSESMEQTLLVGDRVLVNKLVYRFRDIHRGEIVVFDGVDSFSAKPEVICPPAANFFDGARRKVASILGLGVCEKDFIKRVMGLPGDTVQCCSPSGQVIINGQPVDEPYVYEPDRRSFEPVTVPDGKLWVMGDHRSHSQDSRDNGFVPIDNVIGRAFVVIWPPGNTKVLRVPGELKGGKQTESMPTTTVPLQALPYALGLVGALPVSGVRRLMRRRRRR